MTMQILVFNCGSSSVRFALLDPERMAQGLRGIADNLSGAGTTGTRARLRWSDGEGELTRDLDGADHQAALRGVLALLRERDEAWRAIRAVGTGWFTAARIFGSRSSSTIR